MRNHRQRSAHSLLELSICVSIWSIYLFTWLLHKWTTDVCLQHKVCYQTIHLTIQLNKKQFTFSINCITFLCYYSSKRWFCLKSSCCNRSNSYTDIYCQPIDVHQPMIGECISLQGLRQSKVRCSLYEHFSPMSQIWDEGLSVMRAWGRTVTTRLHYPL